MAADASQKPKSIVYLPSTARGLVGKYIRNAVFLIAGSIGASMLNSKSQSVMPLPESAMLEIEEKYNRGNISRNEYEDSLRNFQSTNTDREALSWLLWVSALISGGVAAASGYGIIDNRYRARTVNNVDAERGRITVDKFWFPYGTSTSDIQIDKITQVEATQRSIDRILGTGSVVVQGVVYTAAGSKDVKHTIRYIKDPQEAKNKILELLPERAGLELRLRDNQSETIVSQKIKPTEGVVDIQEQHNPSGMF